MWAQTIASPQGSYTGPTSLGVSVKAHDLAAKLGVSGVVWSLTDTGSGTQGAGSVRVGLDYGAFSQAIGGNYASRLHLVQLPACALTTPELAQCRVQTPLTSANDPKAGTVSAMVTLGSTAVSNAADTSSAARDAVSQVTPAVYTETAQSRPLFAQAASTAGSATVLAATDSTGQEGGAGGTYASTGLSPAGSWSQSGSSGDFTYTYKVQTPGSSTSLAPDASLSYDSGSVDGKTANTQAQASWVGDGWSTQDSSITQSFVPCSDSPEGSAGSVTTPDECYDGQILSLSLNGSSTALVYDSSSSTYRLADDSGATVSHVTNSSNGSGTYNTDYWVITERNGTAYYFGRNQLPGWTSGKATTNSVDYERVYAAHSTDPCYNATPANSYCTMAYQWHLDYVTTVTGSAMAYYYTQGTNYYGANNGADNGASAPKYVRDSYLSHVDYGFTTATGPFGTVPDKIVYTPGLRCVSTANCGTGETSSNAAYYPDVPYDLICAQGATCSAYAPSFFSTVRLTGITTQQYSTASSSYVNVDSYDLTQTEPNTGDATSATLWLASVKRTGNDTTAGGSTSPVPTPAVTFAGSPLENRVDTTTYPGLFRYRITSITSELGGVTGVSYGLPQTCSTSATPSANTASCFPVYWTPKDATAPMLDWFSKYAVQQVLETDTTGGSATKETDYSYLGAAWHYDDNEVVQSKYRTYGQWRGYQQVTTTTGNGASDAKTKDVTLYYQGMDGDYLSPTSTRTVSLTDSQGGSHTDSNQLAGKVLEAKSYLGNDTAIDHGTITSYWISAATATRSRSGLPDLTANLTAAAEVWTQQRLTDGGQISWRYTETDTTYDKTTTDANFGLPTYSYAHTVPVNNAYDRCTSTTYAPANTGLNLVGLVASTESDSAACAGFTEGAISSVPSGLNTLSAPASVNRPDQVVSANEMFYDDTTFSTTFPQTTAPTMGLGTMIRQATTYTSGAFVWRTTARNTYDSTYHRLASVTDGNGNLTTTGYTVNSAYLTTGQIVTQPTVGGVAHVTSTTLDPERGLTLTATDVNQVVTTKQYDALGRPTSVWLNSRATTNLANQTYTYTVSNSSASGVVTNTLNDNSAYLTSVSITDSLGRTRQTQTYTEQGGRLINDSLYDSRGWTSKKNNNHWDPNTTPALAALVPSIADNQVANQDDYTYDGLGRVIYDKSEKYGTVVSTTTTVQNGDATTVIPPSGGVTKTAKTDPLGRKSELDEYSAAPTLTTPANTSTGIFYLTGGTKAATAYGYDGHGQQSTTTDAKGDVWTNGYNIAGQIVSKADPTAGTSTMTYDAAGNLLQTQDARSAYVSYTYDALNRKTGRYAAASSAKVAWTSSTSPGNQSASWVYDNANNAVTSMTYPIGHLTTATSYSDGNPYTQQAVGYNVFGKSLGEQTIIPSAQGTVLGKTWKITHSYTSVLGLLWTDGYGLGGGLPAETITHTYTNDENPYGLASTSYSYVQATSYTAYGQVVQVQLGSSTSYATVADTYDPHTGQLTDQLVTRSTTTPASLDDTTYTYDLAGNPTRQTETRLGSSSTAETQCFTYDALDRLTTAWTATDNCAATPTSSNHATVGDGITGGTYWTSWTHDTIGNRLTQNQHALSGSTDTVTTSTYSTTQPNTLTATSTTGGTTSSYTYDPTGNTTNRNTSTGNQNLTWNNEDELTRVANTTNGNNTSYIYDADGKLLLQIDPATTTLYLGSEQITLTGGTPTGVRYYTAPGGATILRTGTGSNYNFELGADRHSTNNLNLDSTAQTPTWRQFDPYGNPRGAAPSWIDNRTFLNKPTDTTTGLTSIGARYYDPTLGRFISLDPLFEATDPQQLSGYTYAGSNPVTGSDPTGLYRVAPVDGGGGDAGLPPGSTGEVPCSESSACMDWKSGPTSLNHPKLPTAGDTSSSVVAGGSILFGQALDILNNQYKKNWFQYKDRTSIITQMTVTTEDGPAARVVVLVSKEGLPADVVTQLEEAGIEVVTASPNAGTLVKGHAESAAEALRENTATQERLLGGEISEVDTALVTSNVCSEECAGSLTKFIGRSGVKIDPGTRGIVNGEIMDEGFMAKLRATWGSGRPLQVWSRAWNSGGLGGFGGSGGSGMDAEEE